MAIHLMLAVVGLQYYHIAKIVLALSGRPHSLTIYDTLRQSRAIEVHISLPSSSIFADGLVAPQQKIRHHLLQVLGLAQSNPRAENTLFTARHSLVSCECFTILL